MTEIKALLLKHESLCLRPYQDTEGKCTIGVGRNLTDTGISTEEAMFLLANDIERVTNEAKTFPWFDQLSEPRKVAILDMLFNLGLTKFCGFKKMIKAIEVQDFDTAANEMLDSDWAREVSDRAVELAGMMLKS